MARAIVHKAEVSEMLETEYKEAEVMESIRRSSEKIGEEKLAALLRKLTPENEDYFIALNGTGDERALLYQKYGISD